MLDRVGNVIDCIAKCCVLRCCEAWQWRWWWLLLRWHWWLRLFQIDNPKSGGVVTPTNENCLIVDCDGDDMFVEGRNAPSVAEDWERNQGVLGIGKDVARLGGFGK